MDQRLLDNTVDFMNKLNLHNRYDQLTLAGVCMGAMHLPPPQSKEPQLKWKSVFFDHLTTAIDILDRKIKDIYLLEHLDCGAYKYLHPDPKIRLAYSESSEASRLRKFHRDEAHQFASEVKDFCAKQHKLKSKEHDNSWKDIHVHCLLIDLLGNVTDL
jgi:hypothetical protein